MMAKLKRIRFIMLAFSFAKMGIISRVRDSICTFSSPIHPKRRFGRNGYMIVRGGECVRVKASIFAVENNSQ